jgi:hypothetical protein
MGLLDQVSQMKKEGMSNEEITLKMQEQGVSPRTINDVFNQEKIKTAVSAEEKETFADYTQQNPQVPALPQQRTFYQPKTQEVEQTEEEYYSPGEMTAPAPSAPEPPQPQYNQQQYEEAPQEFYPQDQQAYEGGGYSEGGYTADTIIEIAEQVFSEKIKKFERQIDQFNEFANLAQTKISGNSDRIKRIETIIDKLQIAILEKIGSYGQSIEGIKKEMEMIEDSFSKVIPELRKKNTSISTDPKKILETKKNSKRAAKE